MEGQNPAGSLMQIRWTTEIYPGLKAVVCYTDDPANPYGGLVSNLVFLTPAFDERETGEYHKCAWVKVYEELLDPELPWYMQQALLSARKMIRLKNFDVRRPYRTRSRRPRVGRLYYQH